VFFSSSQASPDDQEPRWQYHELDAVACSVAVTASLLAREGLPAELVHPGGCYIWQQPGAALVVRGAWLPGENEPELWYDEGRLYRFLEALPRYSREQPILHPPEELYSNGQELVPTVHLLDAGLARERLLKHYDSYLLWCSFNEGLDLPQVPAEALQVDGAVVFIDSGGPLEFYYQTTESDELVLTHLFIWDFFSA
jgi:hypothetical protein